MTDPVCGMIVDDETGLRATYQGRTYFLCSDRCLGQFNAEPARYAASRPRPRMQHRGSRIAFAVLAAAALFFLLTEHRAHFFGALPYLIVLACPLLHLVMHRGHSHQH